MDKIQNNVTKWWIFISGLEKYFLAQVSPRILKTVVCWGAHVWELTSRHRTVRGEQRAGHTFNLATEMAIA